MKRWSLLLFSAFLPRLSWAAACCGGGFAAPSVIAGDDKAQLTASYSFTQVTVDNVDSRGIWRKWDEHQTVQTLRLEGAHLLSDRWQMGLTLPLVQRTLLAHDYVNLGDISASLAYEYLPDWDYNPWRPKGIGFLQVTLPTGKSRSESTVGGVDSAGNGYWAVGAGSLLTKAIGKYDVFGSFELHRTWSDTRFSGLGGNLSLGGGYNLAALRLGSSVTWTYEEIFAVERFATATVAFSYLPNDDWSGTLSYSDQTLFGNPINTSLGQTVALLVQRRWGR